jgi:hypothetical protein
METQASSHEREEAKRSRGGHGCHHGRREILSLMRAQLVYIGQRMRKVSYLKRDLEIHVKSLSSKILVF